MTGAEWFGLFIIVALVFFACSVLMDGPNE